MPLLQMSAQELEQSVFPPLRGRPEIPVTEWFVQAAQEILEQELNTTVEHRPGLVNDANSPAENVMVMVGVTGECNGFVLYSMSEGTATQIIGRMMGEMVDELDDLALSGIAEIGNMITGRMAMFLTEHDIPTAITPPALIVGTGARLSMAGIQRVAISFQCEFGTISTHIALKEAK